MSVNQLSVFLENEPGKLSEFTRLMKENGIGIFALSIAEVEDFGILRVIVDNTYNASKVLRDAGIVFKITPMLTFSIQNKSGALAEILDTLGKSRINIDYIYTFVADHGSETYVAMRVSEEQKAIAVLKEKGFELVSQEELGAASGK